MFGRSKKPKVELPNVNLSKETVYDQPNFNKPLQDVFYQLNLDRALEIVLLMNRAYHDPNTSDEIRAFIRDTYYLAFNGERHFSHLQSHFSHLFRR